MNATQSAERSEQLTAGGVLSDGAIKREVESGRLIVDGFDASGLKPASYDVTVATDGLIDPGGLAIEPGDERKEKRVVLQPGDAAMFSTREVFSLPETIAGNITIKNSRATEGLMLLSGGLIDPGYGLEEKPGARRGGRLYLHVANIGKRTIEIRPGTEHIARIQFLRVCGSELSREPIAPSQWCEQSKPSLGFLSELKQLKSSSEGTRDLISYIAVGGAFVLLMTLISVALAVILSLSSEAKLVAATKAAVPQTDAGKWLAVAILLGLSVLALGFIVTITPSARRGICRLIDKLRRRAPRPSL